MPSTTLSHFFCSSWIANWLFTEFSHLSFYSLHTAKAEHNSSIHHSFFPFFPWIVLIFFRAHRENIQKQKATVSTFSDKTRKISCVENKAIPFSSDCDDVIVYTECLSTQNCCNFARTRRVVHELCFVPFQENKFLVMNCFGYNQNHSSKKHS